MFRDASDSASATPAATLKTSPPIAVLERCAAEHGTPFHIYSEVRAARRSCGCGLW